MSIIIFLFVEYERNDLVIMNASFDIIKTLFL